MTIIIPRRKLIKGAVAGLITAPAVIRNLYAQVPTTGAGGGAPSSGAAWTPATSTGGVALWYDATNAGSITKTGTAVSQWNDISGNGRNLTQAVTANQPVYTTGGLNGLPVIYFDNGTNNPALAGAMTTATFTLPQPFILMMAIKAIGAQDTFAIMVDGDFTEVAANRIVLFTTRTDISNHAGIYAGTTTMDSGVLLGTNTPYHIQSLFNGASSTTNINGTTAGPGTNIGSFGIVNGITVNSLLGTNNISDFYLGELFIINGSNPTDLAGSLTYIFNKWGI